MSKIQASLGFSAALHAFDARLPMDSRTYDSMVIEGGLRPTWKHRMCSAGSGIDFRSRIILEDMCPTEEVPQNLVVMTTSCVMGLAY